MIDATNSHDILTPQDAAELLRLTPAQLYELTRNRSRVRIPTCRIGKHLRFRRTALLSWLESLEVSQ